MYCRYRPYRYRLIIYGSCYSLPPWWNQRRNICSVFLNRCPELGKQASVLFWFFGLRVALIQKSWMFSCRFCLALHTRSLSIFVYLYRSSSLETFPCCTYLAIACSCSPRCTSRSDFTAFCSFLFKISSLRSSETTISNTLYNVSMESGLHALSALKGLLSTFEASAKPWGNTHALQNSSVLFLKNTFSIFLLEMFSNDWS